MAMYKKGDTVIVTENIRSASVGDILTIKEGPSEAGRYKFNERSYSLQALRFDRYNKPRAGDPEELFNGWVNAETDEAAMVFFNDSNRLGYVREQLLLLKYICVQGASNMVRNIIVNGKQDNVCIRSILVHWLHERLTDEISNTRRQAIQYDLEKAFKYKEPSLADQAQAIAHHTIPKMRTAESFQKVADSLTPADDFNDAIVYALNSIKTKEIQIIMKIETKHYVNGDDIAALTTDQKVALIKKTEDKITELKAVKTKSKMVAAEIDKLQTFLDGAVALFDKE